MMKAKTEMARAYKVEIFIGGNFELAKIACLAYCTEMGLCVTIEPTTYVYRGGMCTGVRIGLINYARFPKESEAIWGLATELAFDLKEKLGQGSFTVQDHKWSRFYTTRPEDGCTGGE